MAIKTKLKASICFIAPIEAESMASIGKGAIKSAYKDLAKQIATFAEAAAADPNIIVSHSVVSENVKDMEPVMRQPADAKMAELQTINKRIADGKSSLTDPHYKSKYEPVNEPTDDSFIEAELDEEKPRVVQHIPEETKVTPAKQVDTILKGKQEITIFSKLRKTEKSLAIIGFLLDHPDKEVSISEIADGTKLKNMDVSIWLAQTGKKLKAIKSGEKRGHYLIDTTKIKVY